MVGCASTLIHRDIPADNAVLLRKWTRPTNFSRAVGSRGFEFSNAITFENTLIFGSRSEGLAAIYPDLNQVRWRLAIPEGVTSILNVHGKSVFFGGGDGFLYAVDADTGKVQWKYFIKNPVASRVTWADGRVYFNTADNIVYALSADKGEWIWQFKRPQEQMATVRGVSAPAIVNDQVYVGLSDGSLVCLKAKDGKLSWEKRLHFGKKFTDLDADPVFNGNTLFMPAYDGALYAIRVQDGEILWKYEAGGGKTVVLDGILVILASSDGNIYALNRDSGKMLWKFSVDAGVPGQVILAGQYLIFCSTQQYLYALDKHSGKAVYRFNLGYDNGFYGLPLYDDSSKTFYSLSSGGNLYAFLVQQPRGPISK